MTEDSMEDRLADVISATPGEKFKLGILGKMASYTMIGIVGLFAGSGYERHVNSVVQDFQQVRIIQGDKGTYLEDSYTGVKYRVRRFGGILTMAESTKEEISLQGKLVSKK